MRKAKRGNLSYGIFSALHRVRAIGFQNIITGDESSFFLYYPHDLIWASARDEVPERVSEKLTPKKA
jgi:hypothetical protein